MMNLSMSADDPDDPPGLVDEPIIKFTFILLYVIVFVACTFGESHYFIIFKFK
jgi:hypothetical protein